MRTNLFSSTPIPGGGTCTLTTYFGDMLSKAETLYGPRLLDWTPIGVEFFDGTTPHIWFPGGRKQVCIRLTMGGLENLEEALWQLSQEIVHVLSPTEKANNLEEGLATHFALTQSPSTDFVLLQQHKQSMEAATCAYSVPLKDCRELLSRDPEVIKRLRAKEPYLSKITAKLILDELPNLPRDIADRLACAF